jgi:putative GTP pyrophosphokinase
VDGEVKQLRDAFERRRPILKEVAAKLCECATQSLEPYDPKHIDRIYFRAKDTDSFVLKVVHRAEDAAAGVQRGGVKLKEYANPLTQVEDQVGGRVLVFYRHDIDEVVNLLTATFHAVEKQDKTPERDAEFGYESTHLVCVIPEELRPPGWGTEALMPETFELQVRTLFMHAWAEPQHNLGYKSAAELTPAQRKLLGWVAASAWGADDGLQRAWTDIGAPTGSH